jgi:hypothetical protein
MPTVASRQAKLRRPWQMMPSGMRSKASTFLFGATMLRRRRRQTLDGRRQSLAAVSLTDTNLRSQIPQPARGTTLLDAITVHKISLSRERKAGQLWGSLWSALRNILAPLAPRRESTFRAVISANPSNAEEALHKALYLIAIVLSERESLDRQQVQRVAASLAPFREETLASLMAGENEAAVATHQTADAGDADVSTTAD